MPNVDISLHRVEDSEPRQLLNSGMRLLDFRSCWIVFIHVVRGRPGGLIQFSKGRLLRSSWHLFCLAFAQYGQTEKRRAWTMAERCGCLVVRLTSSFCSPHVLVPFDS